VTTRVLAVVGPTGTGKSAVAVELAARLGGEVVNADSMQLYRSMDIGTAKLSVDERAGIPHHLLDVWDVTEAADVVRYQQQARACIDEIASRGRVPVLVGGSGLYVRAVLDDLDFPGTDPEVRGRLEAELIDLGPAALHARLAAVDPAAAAAILPSNGRRLVRALEVVAIRGSFTATLPPPSPIYDAFQLALDRPDLDDRLRRRVRQMFERGLVDEVRRLECIGLREGRTASRALGYAQVLRARDAVADGAELGSELARAEADTVTATRRFARRQRSWFRRDASVRWLTAENSSDEFMSEAVTTMEQWWNVSPPRRS
jgi:tRNA dimethylallyltransferase